MTSGDVGYKLSEGVIFHPVDGNSWAVWNRFSPSVVIMIKAGAAWLEETRRDDRGFSEEDIPLDQLESLLQNRLIYKGEEDFYRAKFHQSLDDAMTEINRVTEEFQRDHRPYELLQITNSVCNLACPYCICSHINDFDRTRRPRPHVDDRNHFLLLCRLVDQFVIPRMGPGVSPTPITFNGGEILLDWEVVRSLILYLKEKYPNVIFDFRMNTNATLITEKIAEFLVDHKVGISISIDGYEKSHNQSRIYKGAKNRQNTFPDVMRGVKNYNARQPDVPIQVFQGTIANVDDFDEKAFFQMSRRGFVGARLAPNLLKGNPILGEKAARLITKLHRLSRGRKLKFMDAQLIKSSKLLNDKDYEFHFTCQGLAGNQQRSLSINLTTFELSQLCAFIPSGRVRIQDVNEDIYHPKLFEAADQFVAERTRVLQTVCGECELLGVCRGGCILNGLEVDNTLNDTGCAFQKALWHELLVDSIRQSEPKKMRTKIAANLE